MSKIRVLISDSHSVVRSGIRGLLELEEDIEVVGEAANGKEAVDMTAQLDPDVVLMDIAMPLVDGLGATRRITKGNPKAKVLILAQHDNREYAVSSIRAGASGYMPKKAGPAELVAAIRTVNQGDRFLHPSMVKWLVKEYLQGVDEDTAERPEVLKEPIYVPDTSKDPLVTRAGVSEDVGQMKTEERVNARGGSGGRIPVPAVVGPLLGLLYVFLFPFVVFGTLARVGGSWAMHSLATMWRKLGHVHVPGQ